MLHIISSNVSNLLAKLCVALNEYLLANHASTITRKNYCTDIKIFYSFLLVCDENKFVNLSKPDQLVRLVTEHLLMQFRQYLIATNVPLATANRRLASLRMLGKFALSQGWHTTNPSAHLPIIKASEYLHTTSQHYEESPTTGAHSQIDDLTQAIVTAFLSYLETLAVSEITRINYKSDAITFLKWLQTYQADHWQSLRSHIDFFTSLHMELIYSYKTYLTRRVSSAKTANRKLSTVRMLCKYGLSKGWLSINPSANISNIGTTNDRTSPAQVHTTAIRNSYLDSIACHPSKLPEEKQVIDEFLTWYYDISSLKKRI